MAHKGDDKKSLLPYTLDQNPAPGVLSGQDYETKKQALVDETMRIFMRQLLPSNYVAYTNGPWYTLQFQAIAEQVADIQIIAEEIAKDSDWDFTRTDFLFEVLGTLVFPLATERGGLPRIEGDTEYRAFLHQMVQLLLQGAGLDTLTEGVGLLGVPVEIVEKYLSAKQRDPNGLWDIENQFEMEASINGFPEIDFEQYQQNLNLVLAALKSAHTLFQYRFIFQDVWGPGNGEDTPSDSFGQVFDDSKGFPDVLDPDVETGHRWELDAYYYDDLRKFCHGAKAITGDSGETLADLRLFTDPSRSFASVREGAVLTIEGGLNAGVHKVVEVRFFLYGDDPVARPYTTSPTGLSGTATVEGDTITDLAQDWGSAVEGEILTFTEGPNAGSYRLDTLLGTNGGLVGVASGPSSSVRISPHILRLERRMTVAASGQTYSITVDRLGVQTPKTVVGEDVSDQFYL